MFLPNRLRKCRKETKLSLEKLSVEIRLKTKHSVTRQTLDNWEKGRNQPTLDGIISISTFFNRPLAYFFSQKINFTGESTSKTHETRKSKYEQKSLCLG